MKNEAMIGSQIQGGDKIIKAARVAHEKHRQPTSDVSVATKQATSVTEEWQACVEKPENVLREVHIAEHLNERIDVVDLATATAYEMKVSGKNADHEFYKDIFKVVVYNAHNREKKLRGLVFLTERRGVDDLNKGLGKAVQDIINADVQYGFKVAVVSIRD